MFPGRVHVPPGSLAEQRPQVHCVRGNGSRLAFNFAYSGGGSSGFDVVSHFRGCGFPVGRAIIEIDDHQNTDRTPFQLACSFFVPNGEVQFRAVCGAWSCRVHEFPAGAHNVKVPRHPLWADSPAGV